MKFLYHDLQSRRQHLDRLTMQSQRFSVDHDVNRSIQIKFDMAGLLAFGQRMPHVRAIVKSAQVAHQAQASDRPPADEVNQSIVRVGRWRNHHRATRELAVVETQKKAGSAIEFAFGPSSNGKWPPLQLRQAQKNREPVAQRTGVLEAPLAQDVDIGRKSDAHQIDEIEDSVAISQSQHVASLRSAIR